MSRSDFDDAIEIGFREFSAVVADGVKAHAMLQEMLDEGLAFDRVIGEMLMMRGRRVFPEL